MHQHQPAYLAASIALIPGCLEQIIGHVPTLMSIYLTQKVKLMSMAIIHCLLQTQFVHNDVGQYRQSSSITES
jgi:hypothetical protein